MRTVTLKQDHKQGEVQYYAGQTVQLPDDVAEYLIAVGLEQRAARLQIVEDAPVVEQSKPAVKDNTI